MILKQLDDKSKALQGLESRLSGATCQEKHQIEEDLRILRAGIKGELEAAYFIDFDFKDSQNTAVIHDLRLELSGRVAQIDHVLIHRTLNVFVLETKHFHAGLKITDDGEFLRWNDFRKVYEGMPSPLAQNERHIAVLKEAFGVIEMPARMGLKLEPIFHSYVLISPKARIDRPKRFDTSRIIKSDVLTGKVEHQLQKQGVVGTLSNVARFVSTETIQGIAAQLVALHKPLVPDYAAQFVNTAKPSEVPTRKAHVSSPVKTVFMCRECSSEQISIQYGKFGYYFKCGKCAGNTPIRISCGVDGHRERIRKSGNKFYRECADCGTSSLFFENSCSIK